jgi:hypothetical protein
MKETQKQGSGYPLPALIFLIFITQFLLPATPKPTLVSLYRDNLASLVVPDVVSA